MHMAATAMAPPTVADGADQGPSNPNSQPLFSRYSITSVQVIPASTRIDIDSSFKLRILLIRVRSTIIEESTKGIGAPHMLEPAPLTITGFFSFVANLKRCCISSFEFGMTTYSGNRGSNDPASLE